jgi:DNA invertase Pin-like site-specific DNA recombinase
VRFLVANRRTRTSVKAAKRRGVKSGRKPKLSPEQVEHAHEQIERGKTAQEVAALLKVGRATLWRALRA